VREPSAGGAAESAEAADERMKVRRHTSLAAARGADVALCFPSPAPAVSYLAFCKVTCAFGPRGADARRGRARGAGHQHGVRRSVRPRGAPLLRPLHAPVAPRPAPRAAPRALRGGNAHACSRMKPLARRRPAPPRAAQSQRPPSSAGAGSSRPRRTSASCTHRPTRLVPGPRGRARKCA